MTTRLLKQLADDETGFIVSAELILIGMIVGLSEVAHGVNEELEDVGAAIGMVNQSFWLAGASGPKADHPGSFFDDHVDECDNGFDIRCDGPVLAEVDKFDY